MNDDNVLLFFAQWIERECGIVYEAHNFYQLKERMDRIIKEEHLGNYSELMDRMKVGLSSKLKQHIVDISTNNETSFFRDTKFFNCLEKNILPDLAGTKKNFNDIKVWSVASSTGQEPYSVAMLLYELSQRSPRQASQLIATDICSRVLEKASQARYTDLEVSRGLSENRKKLYFKVDDKGFWVLNSEIRKMVQFAQLNLLDTYPFTERFDLILCRNVLIYQRVEAKRKIVQKLREKLNPGGILLLGAGESLLGLSSDFTQSLVDGVSVYKNGLKAKDAA